MQVNRQESQQGIEIKKIEIDIPEIYFDLSQGKSVDLIYYIKDENWFEAN